MKKIIIALLVIFLLVVQPAQASANDTFYGVEVTRLANYTIAFNQVFPFGAVRFGLPAMWNSGDPSKIIIPLNGVWMVGAEITTLGLYYGNIGGTNNSRVILEIVKNWNGNEKTTPHLASDICWNRFENQTAYGANGNNVACPVILAQGDSIQLLITGYGNLLVESNPNNSGTLSPHFYAYYLGAAP